MRYIIDTHIFLWLIFEPDKIEETKLEILKNPKNKISVVDTTFWEISLKFGLGKLELHGINPEELPSIAQKMGIDVLSIGKDIMASFYKLPKIDTHKDPFDRILIWKCINENTVLVSKDRKFSFYEALGLRWL